ncbi:bifunctional hemolysin/adenylate cyclase precursor [mine drainage metagenome]|uniref:Bifunctional hemolysin/adenylate cyclase n=1 Tax=mine drainage metagenome TaxID=410659 RepID=A0A1J5SCG8_9ZZZZ
MPSQTNTIPTGNNIVAAAITRFFNPAQPWVYLEVPTTVQYPVYVAQGKTSNATTPTSIGPTVDCSHLVYQTMLASGYNVSYIPTPDMNNILHGAASSNYSVVSEGITSLNNVQAGDIVVFYGHTGIIQNFTVDPTTGVGTGTYLGAQSNNSGLLESVKFTTDPQAQGYFWGGTSTAGSEAFTGVLRPSAQAYDPASAASALNLINEKTDALLSYANLGPYFPQSTITPTTNPDGSVTTKFSDGSTLTKINNTADNSYSEISRLSDGTLVSTSTTNILIGSTGNVIGYAVSVSNPITGTAIATTALADGSIASQTISDGTTLTTTQGGITTTTNIATGVTTADIAGIGNSLPVYSDGTINAGKYLITLPPNPLDGINLQTAGGASYTVPAGANIQSNGESLIVQNGGPNGLPSALINPDGSGVKFNYDSSGGFTGTTPIGNDATLAGMLTSLVQTAGQSALDFLIPSAYGTDTITNTSGTTSISSTDSSSGSTFSLDYNSSAGNVSGISIKTPQTQTVDTVLSGNTVSVTYTQDPVTGQPVAHVNSINGQPPTDQAAADAAFNNTGVLPGQLVQGDSGVAGVTGSNPSGVVATFDATHPSGTQALVQGLHTTADALSLIQAIQSGKPLPITVSGLNLINQVYGSKDYPSLSGSASIGNGLLDLISLNNALKTGNTLGAIVAGAQTAGAVAQAAVNFGAGQGMADFANTMNGTQGVSSGANAVYDANGTITNPTDTIGVVSYLSLANDISTHNDVGVALDVITMINPVVGTALRVVDMVYNMFSGTPSYPAQWGSGQYVWNGTGISVSAAGQSGGDQMVSSFMNDVLTSMNTLIAQEQQQNPGSPLGIIPSRMPTLTLGPDGYRFTDINPLTGAQNNPGLRYDTSGKPYNAVPGSPESFQSLGQAFLDSAIARGAIAPQWEVQTAAMQFQAGDPLAGLTEEARAARAGDLAAPATGATQTWRPVVLDLNGTGIQTISAAQSGVAFNVDDSGYLKNTAWIGNNDAFLTLDRNYNGVVDSGKEMFSNSAVGLDRQGLAGLAWMDANGDGVINASDPVFNQMRIWQDKNGNGIADAGEMTTLAQDGITSLNYAMGTFVENGVTHQMASPDLTASTAGDKVSVVPQGILVQSSAGQTSLLVSRVDNLTQIQANESHVTGRENTELIVNSADLLANDTFGGFTGKDLQLTGVLNAQHGTAFVDANGFVHFQPDTNFFGDGASFDYSILGPNGQTATATVLLSMTHIDQPPTVASVTHDTRAIYGYKPNTYSHGRIVSYGSAIYSPYTTTSRSRSGQTIITNHDKAIAYDDPGSGNIVASDAGNPVTPNSSFTYKIIGQPQEGAASIDSTGHFQYTSWQKPNVVSAPDYQGDPTSTDSFEVQVTDQNGLSVTQTINATHYGAYTPPAPPGGGGGGGCFPIAIDLNNQGIAFTPVDQSNVFAQVNNDGWKHQTSWITPGEGVLAYDPNGTGKITSASQISFAQYLPGAQTDLGGLAAFDSNHDGIFNKNDAAWSKFGVWVATDQNGGGQFETLDQLGVASISLTSDNQFSVVNGDTVHGVATVTMTDGTTRNAADVTLAYSNQVQITNPDGTTSVASLPPIPAATQQVVGSGNNVITATPGNTNITVGDGNNVIFSGDGNDVIQAGNGNNVIYAGNGNDLVLAGNGNNAIYTGRGNDVIIAGNGHNAIFAGGGNDVILAGNGNNLISGGTGNDVIRVGDGNNTVYLGNGNTAVFAGNGDNLLLGGDGTDRMQVGNGNDTLIAGSGLATMTGGTGNDTFVVNNVNDVVQAQAAGMNTIQSSVDYTASANVQNLTGIGSANITLTGNNLDNVITGNSGNDILVAGSGNDTLVAGSGVATMIGGTGNETFVVNNVNDVVQAQFSGSNINTVLTSVNYVAPANVQNLTGTGTADLTLTGNNLNNVITANSGNDTLVAGSGVATMIGGAGNDTFVVNNIGDVVIEKPNEGIDTVMASVSYALSANVENLTGTGNANITLTGNNLNNVITGNSGNDILVAGSGNDTLVAGSGVATMIGGTGNDTFVVNNVNDVVEAQSSGSNINTVLTSLSYVAPANVQNLTGTGTADLTLTGNDLNNVITANSGNDTLVAGSGVATMVGGVGNDTFIVNNSADVVLAQANAGINTVQSSVDFSMGSNAQNVQNLTLTADNVSGTGNALNNNLVALGANDTLIAGSGVATMTGSGLNDTFVVNNVNDVVIEQPSQGNNTVLTSVSYVAPANVQNLTGTGTADLTLTGNNLNNVITANSGNDTLIASSGVATMIGGTGNDTFVVNNTNDVVQAQSSGSNINTLLTSVNYVAPANVQNLTGTGTADLTLTGNDLNNVITANSGNDTLIAGSGLAMMVGGTGNDLFIVNNSADTVEAQLTGSNTNTVESSVNYSLADQAQNVQNLTGIGSADITLTGNSLDNVITANSGNDTLVAGSGVATMIGGAGNDTFVVDNVNDVVQAQSTGNNINTVLTSVSYVAPVNVQNLTGTGTTDLTLTGNSLDNTIIANSGNDTLIAGSGEATMIGGTGNDTFVVNNVNDVVQAQSTGSNINTVLTSVSYVAPANVQNLTGTGTADLTLTGNSLDNIITANSGNDTLIAGSGVATMIGGTGSDTFVVNNVNDVVQAQSSGSNINTVLTSVSYVAPVNVQNLTGTGSADITLTGNSLNNVITANSGNDTLIAGSGVATMIGGTGSDTFVVNNVNDVVQAQSSGNNINTVLTSVSYVAPANVQNLTGLGSADLTLTGNSLDNTITANSGNDTMIGGGGNDTFVGGAGNDLMLGGTGNDTYVYNRGNGLDNLVDTGGTNTIRLGAGLSYLNVVVRLTYADGTPYTVYANGNRERDHRDEGDHYGEGRHTSTNLIAHMMVLDSNGVEQPSQGMDFAVTVDNHGNFTSPIQSFQFSDGSSQTFGSMLVKTETIDAEHIRGPVMTGRNDTIVYAGRDNTGIWLGTGNDTVYASERGSLVYAGGGNDYLVGSRGNDTFVGGWGVDILQGGEGSDVLSDLHGRAALLGGEGSDTITAGAGNDFIAGGRGNDIISTGATHNVIAFNKGDGRDTILATPGASNTLSLGGEVNYRDLSLSKNGNDLVLNEGRESSVTFKDWYASSANHDFVTLQIIGQQSGEDDRCRSHDAASASKVNEFDFSKLVAMFDQAIASKPSLNQWSLMDGLLNAHLASSDTAALGGDLAYVYGTHGSLSGMGLSAAQNTLKDPQFGTTAQTLHLWPTLNSGTAQIR